MQPQGEVVVTSGDIIVYRLFELADSINLDLAEKHWLEHTGSLGARRKLQATPAKAVAYNVPPVVLTLDPLPLKLRTEDQAARNVEAQVTARLYDIGIVTLTMRFSVSHLGWHAYSALLNAINATVGPTSGSLLWRDMVKALRGPLDGALDKPIDSPLEEDYIVGFVRSFDRPLTGQQILNEIDLVPLLSGETLPLSERARQDLLRNHFSYYLDDLAVLTWDRALVVDPRGDSDVLDVVEVANAQLLEISYFNKLLTDELPRMYDLVETTHRSSGLWSSRRLAGLARRLYTLFAEVTEVKEHVDNVLTVTEDVYLARIYAASLTLFQVNAVGNAVDQKLAIIRDTYMALYDDASGGRADAMEIAVVALIALEIILTLIHW
ncbi:hypothetical protein [Beijerinckia indica]|uniref:DUF155 domain-containing protein n=1 Tax=Beijerinckia indica subsp. indica (strain ATCC 9039 / DSM 1715 / NCIMB 8712) TaxID=395963 RepID=B2IEN1_BEII9|nr:hypothetical protein [Beijerinckia indica]ACB96971.1 conserved hypothetical protein [Beijerinckia indica subsp. indica ATCC 9039]